MAAVGRGKQERLTIRLWERLLSQSGLDRGTHTWIPEWCIVFWFVGVYLLFLWCLSILYIILFKKSKFFFVVSSIRESVARSRRDPQEGDGGDVPSRRDPQEATWWGDDGLGEAVYPKSAVSVAVSTSPSVRVLIFGCMFMNSCHTKQSYLNFVYRTICIYSARIIVDWTLINVWYLISSF